jgi:hypothetical protein
VIFCVRKQKDVDYGTTLFTFNFEAEVSVSPNCEYSMIALRKKKIFDESATIPGFIDSINKR